MRTPNLQDSSSKISTAAEESLVAKDNGSLLAFGSFLVPVDFSPHSNETIKYAAGLAALTGANMRIMHVFQIPEYGPVRNPDVVVIRKEQKNGRYSQHLLMHTLSRKI